MCLNSSAAVDVEISKLSNNRPLDGADPKKRKSSRFGHKRHSALVGSVEVLRAIAWRR